MYLYRALFIGDLYESLDVCVQMHINLCVYSLPDKICTCQQQKYKQQQ